MEIKKDQYQSARGGTSQFLDIRCRKCQTDILAYSEFPLKANNINVGDKRSFRSGENLGKLRAEQFSFYPLLYNPNETKCSESAAWLEL